MKPFKSLSPLFVLALILALPLMQACQVVGVIAAKAPQEEPAEFILAEVPTLVLVEDSKGKIRYVKTPQFISAQLENELLAYQAIPEGMLIEQQKVFDLKSKHEDFDEWSIGKIGEAVGAEQVIFVSIREFRLEAAQMVYRPQIMARVRVLDIKNKKMSFPKDQTSTGREIEAELFYESAEIGEKAQEFELTQEVSKKLAVKIGNLFHPWIIPYSGDRSDYSNDLKR